MRRLILAVLFLVLAHAAAYAACPATLADCPDINADTGRFGGELSAPVKATGGSTSRQLADHFADMINIKDLGAVGDGVADDSPAFTASVALSGSRAIYLPCGTYLLGSARTFAYNQNRIYRGAGRECVTIKVPPATSLSATMFNFTAGATHSSSFSDVTFDMTNLIATSAGVPAVLGANLHRLDVKRVAFIGAALNQNFYYLVMTGVNGFNVEDNIFSFTAPPSGSTIGAFSVTRAGTTAATNGRYVGNLHHNTAIQIEAFNTLVAKNTFDDTGANAGPIYVPWTAPGYSGNIIIDSNVIAGITPTGVNTPSIPLFAPAISVTNNIIHNVPGTAIIIWGPNNIVTGNTIYDAGMNAASGAPGISLAWLSATVTATGTYVANNNVYDTGNGRVTMGIADQTINGGVGCNLTTNLCKAIIGNNRISGTPNGAIVIRGTSVYDQRHTIDGGTSTGTATAQTIIATVPPIIPSTFVAGLTMTFIPVATNTGALTLNTQTGIPTNFTDFYNVSAKVTGPIAVKKKSGATLVDVAANDVVANMPATVVYDGTVWILR